MNIATETELMKNQKHAEVMSPDASFEVLQTTDGGALFFSIGTDQVFYVTREVSATQTGWTKVDLSSPLSASQGNAPIIAKSFSLSQNAQTLAFDLALVITVAGADLLYVSLNNTNTADAWAKNIPWTLLPFDAAGVKLPIPLTIADVYLMNMPSPDGQGYPPVQNCFVDILRSPGSPLQLLDRYYIQPYATPHWVRHTLAADLKAGSISSCLGNRSNDYVPGIYTFGVIGTTMELIYTPQYNYFRPAVAPNTARLILPTGSTAIASALNSAGTTNLFVTGANGIYVFTPDNQGDQSVPILVVPAVTIAGSSILGGVSSLSASTTDSFTVVWGLNASGAVFHVSCPQGSEANPSSWSTPMALCSGVEGFAFFLNLKASYNILFAHLSGQQLLQFTQDPMTSLWSQRSILLPPTAVTDMIEYYSFTSHIKIMDANNTGVPNTPVTLTSTSPVSVYANNVYQTLTSTVPVAATSDATGTITVVQETQSLSAVCFQVTIIGPPPVVAAVDPLAKAMQTLSTVQNGTDLSGVEIKTADGTQQPLVPESVPSNIRDTAAKSIANLVQIKATLPADGSRKTDTTPLSSNKLSRPVSNEPAEQPQTLWGVSLRNGGKYYEGDAAIQRLNVRAQASLAAQPIRLNILDTIMIDAGDLFQYLKSAWDVVKSFVVQEAEGFYHFLATIDNKVYNAVLDSISAVVGAVEFVFQQIKVAFEDLVAWLGFLFDWDDIKRTHSVMKNVFKTYATNAIDSLDTIEDSINNAFIGLEDKINGWAGVTDSSETVGTRQQAISKVSGNNSPQANWALFHSQSNVSSAESSYTSSNTVPTTFDQLFQDLESLVTNEADYIQTTATQIKQQIVDLFSSLTPSELFQKVIAIITDLLLKTTRNIIVKAIDILKIIATNLLDLLDAPINIPIISPIYKQISGDDLSFLDLITLVGAIPATIMYKLMSGKSPYPDNAQTTALINAPDFSTLQKIMAGEATVTTPKQNFSARHSALKEIQKSNAHARPQLKLAVDANALQIASIIFDFGALFGSAFTAYFAYIKFNLPDGEVPPNVVRYCSCASYLLYVGPDIVGMFSSPGAWYTQMNDTVTWIATLKTFADNTELLVTKDTWNNKISPVLESVINLVWIVPDAAQLVKSGFQATDYVSFSANLAFDLSGVLTVVFSKLDPYRGARVVAFTAAEVLTGSYGVLCAVNGQILLAS